MATPGSTGTINLTEKADPKVMERFKQKSVTEGLFSNEYSWEGNATVKFPSIDTVPLNDYNQERIDGGSRYGSLINLGDTWQEHTVKERKSFMFAIDETYNTQQMQIKRASQCLKRELDEVVIPYVDKYRIRKMAAAGTSANHNIASETLTKGNIIETIFGVNAAMSENLVPEGGRICYISHKTAIKTNLAEQVVGAAGYSSGVGANTIGQKSIVSGALGQIDGTTIKRVPSGYLPNNVEMLFVKKGICFAPNQLKSYKIHPGAHVLEGKIATGLIQHDCFVPVGRENCIFVVTATGGGSIAIVGTGVLTVTSGTATVTSGATSIAKSGGAKNVTVSTESSGVVTADVIGVASADESVFKAQYDPYTNLITITPLKAGTANMVVSANGKIGYTTPADVTIAVTVT